MSQIHREQLQVNSLATVLARFYSGSSHGKALLSAISHLEGGQMFSGTLRRLLQVHHGVKVGAFSYGSLLVPGMADRNTVIGRYVSVGPNVRRFGAAHPLDSLSLHPFWYNPDLGLALPEHDVPRTMMEIGPDCWIGANVTILPGCSRIGTGCVIGVGSVVTKDIADFSVAMGNPARVKSLRLTESLRQALLRQKPWEHAPSEFRQICD